MAKSSIYRCACCKQQKPVKEFRECFRLRRGHHGTCIKCQGRRSEKVRLEKKTHKCSVVMCDRGQMARGMCGMHYMRWKKTGEPGPARPLVYKDKKERPLCIERGCNGPTYCNRRCKKHYYAFKWRTAGVCKIDGCRNTAISKKHGLCLKHDAKRRRWGDPLATRPPSKCGPGVVCSVDACGRVVIARGYCASHYQAFNRDGVAKLKEVLPLGTKRQDRGGYVLIKTPGHSAACRGGGDWAAEHRVVMSDALKRPLRDNENVHHKNGKRSDNRAENLELWVKTQPCGQRPEDLVDWAEEILRLYKDEVKKLRRSHLRAVS